MKRWIAMGALAGLIALAGCGGGGGGATGTSGGTRAAVLVTDSFREDFGHVWATIYHVELVPQGGGAAVVLFDDPSGRQIDLKTLRDSTGALYSFLGNGTVPAGTYTGANVTIGSTMQLFRNGTAVGDPIPVDSSIPTDSSGNPIVSVTFKRPKTLGSGTTNNIVIDFDLAHFILRDSKVLPALAEGDGNGLNDPARHCQDEYHGTISNLTGTAPTLTFTLNRGNGMVVTVATTASTAIYGSGTLTDGAVVEVQGTLDPTTQNLVATQIEVGGGSGHEAEGHRTPRVLGTASDLNATAGTFTLTEVLARGFTPGKATVTVVTNSSTTFRSDAGATIAQADFFTALASAPAVQVEGTFDSSTNTLTATTAKIVDPTKNGGWEHDSHNFRDARGRGGWGNGLLPGGGGDGPLHP